MKKVLALTICFAFVGMGSALAQVELPRHSWDLGTEISYIKYEEPDVMEEKGVMWGVLGSYTYRENWMLKADGKFSYGQVDYENSGTMDNIDDYMLEFRGLGGYDFPVLKATILTPYIGFGYRYLNDDSSGMTTSTGALGYERESNYYYSPIGIETITELENGWSIGVTFEYDYFWKGIQKSSLGGIELENDQNDGYGLRGSIKFQKKGEKVDYVIEPFIRYWDIEDSEVSPITWSGYVLGYGYEPENNSTEIGIKFVAKF